MALDPKILHAYSIYTYAFFNTFYKVRMAEQSKVPVSGTVPKGCGFKSHSWHKYFSRTSLHFHNNYSSHSNYVMKGSYSSFQIKVYVTFITLINIPREVLKCFYLVMRLIFSVGSIMHRFKSQSWPEFFIYFDSCIKSYFHSITTWSGKIRLLK